MSTRWKETAWSGIRFHTPNGWDITKIGKQYLFFENEDHPVLEVKWNAIKGHFSHKRHLRRLNTLHGKTDARRIVPWEIPPRLHQALKGYDVSGFSWKNPQLQGKGTILYCPECGNATIIQFYHPDAEADEGLISRVLKSFRDHHSKEEIPWSIYDIRLVVPKSFGLVRYRFDPGHFLLVFSSHGQKISFHRWSPAHALLKGSDLTTFAASRIPAVSSTGMAQTETEPDALAWGTTAEISAWSFWRNRIRKKPSFRWIEIWYEKKKNRILAIHAEGIQPLDKCALKHMRGGYENL